MGPLYMGCLSGYPRSRSSWSEHVGALNVTNQSRQVVLRGSRNLLRRGPKESPWSLLGSQSPLFLRALEFLGPQVTAAINICLEALWKL